MALKPCKECGKEISTKAEKCPNCGVEISKKTSIGTWIGSAFIIYLLYSIGTCSSPPATKQTSTKPIDAMQEYNSLMQKHAEDKRFEITAGAAQIVKNSLRDPRSVEWENIQSNEDASLICIEYRAKNGFGGLNKEFVLFKNKLPSHSVKTWNKECAHADLFNMDFVKHALK